VKTSHGTIRKEPMHGIHPKDGAGHRRIRRVGRALRRLFAQDGHHVVLVARRRDKLEQVAALPILTSPHRLDGSLRGS
jgi:hypothetical protein